LFSRIASGNGSPYYLAMKILVLALLWAAEVNLTGKWSCTVETDAGSGTPTFQFTQKDSVLTGRYSGQLGEADVRGKVDGSKVEWSFDTSGAKILYTGTIEGQVLKGKVDLAGQASGNFTCKR
jgi:hypothetical protein